MLKHKNLLSKNNIDATLIYILSLGGLLNAGYLWYQYQVLDSVTCSLSGCNEVRQSEYSMFLGIDLPIWGFIFFFLLAIYMMCKLGKSSYHRLELVGLSIYTGFGFLFSIYLTYLEIFEIKALCQWCLISAIISILVFLTSIYVVFKMWSSSTDNLHRKPDSPKPVIQ